MYVPVSSFNFIGNLAASMTEWQLILKKGGSFQFSGFRRLGLMNYRPTKNWKMENCASYASFQKRRQKQSFKL
jgi:hypothetical protein